MTRFTHALMHWLAAQPCVSSLVVASDPASANATAAASFSSSEACAAAGGVTALGGGGEKADMPAISTQIASACSGVRGDNQLTATQ